LRVAGSYYTPADLVDAITLRALGPLCRSESLSILDPACGAGAFLLGAQRYLLKHRPATAGSTFLHGIDVDPGAVDVCQAALPHTDIHCGNALLGPDILANHAPMPLPFRGPCRDWRRVFANVFARGGFDAVIGNPPWVSLAGRFAPIRMPKPIVAYLARRFAGSTYQPNLFEYFVALALEWTRPGGFIGLVLPDRLAFNRQYAGLRERLLRETSLLYVLYDFSFPGVTADSMILVCRKGVAAADHCVEIGSLHGEHKEVSQAALRRGRECRFERQHDAPVQSLLQKMREAIPLRDIAEIASGFGGRSSLFTTTRLHRKQIPVIKGVSIRRYAIGQPLWFDFRKENLTGRTVDVTKLGAVPKIVLRKTGDRLIAALDEAGIFPDQSLYLLHQCKLDVHFLLGVLNSTPLTFYLRACSLTNPRTIAQVKKSDLGDLPVPRVDVARRKALIALVQRRMDEESQGMDTAATEHAIDAEVASLFGLSSSQLTRCQRGA
jgi:hypothetical protein